MRACAALLLAVGAAADPWQPVRDAIDGFGMIAGCTLAVANESGVVFKHEKGGVTPTTQQEIWSATKWIVGTAIMREVQNGVVQLDAPVSSVLSYWTKDKDDSRSSISLRHLLGFASGYTDITQTNGYMLPLKCMWADLQGCAEATYENSKHNHTPGSIIDYNSVHLTLAGAAVEKATGKRILDIIKANVFEPAGMTQTYFRDHSDRNPFLAGGIVSTADDYMRFLQGVYEGTLVSKSTAAEMMKNGFPEAKKHGIFTLLAARYGLASWVECPRVISVMPWVWSEKCDEAMISTSPGASGAYPLIDRKNGYYYYFGYDSSLIGVGAAISAVFRDTLKPLVDNAMVGGSAKLPTAVPAKRLACLQKAVEEAIAEPSEARLAVMLRKLQC